MSTDTAQAPTPRTVREELRQYAIEKRGTTDYAASVMCQRAMLCLDDLERELAQARADLEERDRLVLDCQAIISRQVDDVKKLCVQNTELRAQLEALRHDIAQYVKRDTERLAQLAQAREWKENVLNRRRNVIERIKTLGDKHTPHFDLNEDSILREERSMFFALIDAAIAQAGEKTCKE